MLLNCDKLRNLVAERGMTHKQLADASGMSVTWIDELFRHNSKKIRVSTAGKLAGALGVKPSDIEISSDDLLLRYAVLKEKESQLQSQGLTIAANIVLKELVKIEKQLT